MLRALAEFTPLPPAAQWAIVSVLGVLLTLALIWSIVRRKPTLDAELVKIHSAVESLQIAVNSLNETATRYAGHATEIKALQDKVGALEASRENDRRAREDELKALETKREHDRKAREEEIKSLGARREEDLRAQRTYTRETTHEIFLALDDLKKSFNQNMQSVERAIGKLEGSMDGLDTRVSRLESVPA